MVDPTDKVTPTLPGIEPLPPMALEEMTQAARREALQFMGPKERPRCGSCRHVEVLQVPARLKGQPAEVERMRCSLAGFPVQAGAICSRHQATDKGAAKC